MQVRNLYREENKSWLKQDAKQSGTKRYWWMSKEELSYCMGNRSNVIGETSRGIPIRSTGYYQPKKPEDPASTVKNLFNDDTVSWLREEA